MDRIRFCSKAKLLDLLIRYAPWLGCDCEVPVRDSERNLCRACGNPMGEKSVADKNVETAL
jgi:hypothetical protein